MHEVADLPGGSSCSLLLLSEVSVRVAGCCQPAGPAYQQLSTGAGAMVDDVSKSAFFPVVLSLLLPLCHVLYFEFHVYLLVLPPLLLTRAIEGVCI